ncbi:alpha-hydroxy-acid oxidizing protein [uncultured Arthrobacter sp.]|uniref:alpha-hydroxy-acid oxidizing protein n=1 Tax=uncultured Arthrobacter sp. TaxID=114050 RepID=UPI0025CEA39D|nr:alpha-hydroxy-acid oxidizing protein [uncultured Arthrobacter sp.]
MTAGARRLTSVADAQARANRRLPRAVRLAVDGGSGCGDVRTRNTDAFRELLLDARVGDQPERPDTRTTVLGRELGLPVIIAPVGAQAVRPRAEIAAARAASRARTAIGVSNFSETAIEEIVPHNPSTLAQLYWVGTREEIAERIERFRRAGAAGLIFTMDWSVNPGVDWPTDPMFESIDVRAALRFGPQVLARPRWLAGFLRAGGLPGLLVPNFATTSRPEWGFAEALRALNRGPRPTWDDVAWVREVWGPDLPFVVKGVLHPDDARRACDAGASAVSVSNHGGNDFDGVTSSLAALPRVVDAVGDRIEVLLDGGVRRGADVVKAIAMGARAVLVGRAYLWALAARGEDGVVEMLEVMRAGIEQAMRVIKAEDVGQIRREHVLLATTGPTRGVPR